jgi:hypothetical protein
MILKLRPKWFIELVIGLSYCMEAAVNIQIDNTIYNLFI